MFLLVHLKVPAKHMAPPKKSAFVQAEYRNRLKVDPADSDPPEFN